MDWILDSTRTISADKFLTYNAMMDMASAENQTPMPRYLNPSILNHRWGYWDFPALSFSSAFPDSNAESKKGNWYNFQAW